MVEKLERNGNVAVLYSPDFGAGWSTWNNEHAESLIFDRAISEAVERGDYEKAEAIALERYPDIYTGGLRDLVIKWVPKGTRFLIREYDGSESVEILTPDSGFVA